MLLTNFSTNSQKNNIVEGRRLHFYDKGELIPLAQMESGKSIDG